MDAGNVAPRIGDLNFDQRSFGGGLRLHTRRETFALVDVAHGSEGWRFLFRLTDPLNLSRLTAADGRRAVRSVDTRKEKRR